MINNEVPPNLIFERNTAIKTTNNNKFDWVCSLALGLNQTFFLFWKFLHFSTIKKGKFIQVTFFIF